VSDYPGVITGRKAKVDVCTFEYTGSSGASAEATAQRRQDKERRDAEVARLSAVPETLLSLATSLLPTSTLKTTLTDEALFATQPSKYKTWGKHYLATLPLMLRSERRSNFRDQALQHFGRDAQANEAFFERLSGEAELCFAQLEPPKPSNIGKIARQKAAAASAAAYRSMPEEFMRGGGCFAPDAMVACVGIDGDGIGVRIDELAAGMRVRTASGGTARVQCVVQSPCGQGYTVLSQLASGLCLTEWHPIQDGRGQWRFPLLVGRRVVRRYAFVYNLVLEHEHVAMIGGVPCVTLGHGIDGPVVGHPFWGTPAVIAMLAAQPGWSRGQVILDGPLCAPTGVSDSSLPAVA